MLRLLHFLVLALLLSAPVYAQTKFSVAPRIGYGSFNMSGMRSLQRAIIENSNLNAKVTTDYPAYYQVGVVLGYKVTDVLSTGIVLDAGSTGGRIAYADYSGSYRVDQLVKYKAAGAFIEHAFHVSKPVFFGGLEATAMKSTLTVETAYRIHSAGAEGTEELVALGVGVKPYAGVTYQIKRLLPRLDVGYLVNFNQPFHLPDDKDAVLTVNNKETGPNWSGFRVNLSLGLMLFE